MIPSAVPRPARRMETTAGLRPATTGSSISATGVSIRARVIGRGCDELVGHQQAAHPSALSEQAGRRFGPPHQGNLCCTSGWSTIKRLATRADAYTCSTGTLVMGAVAYWRGQEVVEADRQPIETGQLSLARRCSPPYVGRICSADASVKLRRWITSFRMLRRADRQRFLDALLADIERGPPSRRCRPHPPDRPRYSRWLRPPTATGARCIPAILSLVRGVVVAAQPSAPTIASASPSRSIGSAAKTGVTTGQMGVLEM